MRPTRQTSVRRWGVVLAIALLTVCASARLGQAQSVWELTPYKIGLLVAVDPTAGLGERLQQELPTALVGQIEMGVGAAWDTQLLKLTPPLRYRITGNLEGLTPEDLDKKALACDKIFFVSVGRGPKGWQVRARELDGRTQIFGPIITRPVGQTAKIRDAAFDALVDAFVPLAMITQTRGNKSILRLRAGELPIRDASIGQVKLGDVFWPIVRYCTRTGEIRKIEPSHWTYLFVEKIDETALECQVHTAIASSMSGRRRGRVEPLALLVRPQGETTKIFLRSRTEPPRPLVGYAIYARSPLDDPRNKNRTFLGRTDVDGSFVVEPGRTTLRLLDVRHGGGLLGRLPVVPGFTEVETGNVRNDDTRMAAEAYTNSVQEQLIDTVTRRKILIGRARKQLKEKAFEKVEETREQIEELPTQDDILRELGQQQIKLRSDNTFMQKQIDSMFDRTKVMVTKFLDRQSIEALKEDITNARTGKRRAPPAASQKPAKKPAAKK
ncbi:MAG: hypothetical protein JW818_14145 [Pirellulales bacterium]|nr:hypothetical protein [Pirellulales bacterium]